MSEDDLDEYACSTATVVREGAAVDGAEAEEVVSQFPRLLRYATLSLDVEGRIAAEVVELDPKAAVDAARWSEAVLDTGWLALAGRLDQAAVRLDQPALRTLSDAVRLTSMPMSALWHRTQVR